MLKYGKLQHQPQYMKFNSLAHEYYTKFLESINTDLDDPNFKDTPIRVVKAVTDMIQFEDNELLQTELDNLFSKAFPSTYKGMVIVDNIKAKSMCPHHMLPVKYVVDLGYISTTGKAIGISKLPRLVKILAKRRVLQESYTNDIALLLYNTLKAAGVMVIVRGDHTCMTCRGTNETDASTITSSVYGVFESDVGARQEFLSLLSNRK